MMTPEEFRRRCPIALVYVPMEGFFFFQRDVNDIPTWFWDCAERNTVAEIQKAFGVHKSYARRFLSELRHSEIFRVEDEAISGFIIRDSETIH
jgi:hypothetical protein